jgi:hypothetical protein
MRAKEPEMCVGDRWALFGLGGAEDERGERSGGVRWCGAHCDACGTHFSSDAAFDLHRVGSFNDPANPRRCEHPLDAPPKRNGQPRFAVLTDTGGCRVHEHREGYGIERPVTLWTLGDIEQRRAKLAARRATREQAT